MNHFSEVRVTLGQSSMRIKNLSGLGNRVVFETTGEKFRYLNYRIFISFVILMLSILANSQVWAAKTTSDFELSNKQKILVGSLKNKYNEFSENINIKANFGADATESPSKYTGQCVSYVKNARTELDYVWDNAKGLTQGAKDKGFHIDITPRVGSAFVKIKSDLQSSIDEKYGHTGIVTDVNIIKKDGDLKYQIGIK